MKKIILVLSVISVFIATSYAQEKEFSNEVLKSNFVNEEGRQVSFNEILEQSRKKTTLIDVWASWCSDCVKGMPEVQAIQEKFGDKVNFVFISYDKSFKAWKTGIEKNNVKGLLFYSKTPWKESTFAKHIELDWIPRYMVIGKDGSIKLFNATKATDERIIKAIKEDNTLKGLHK